MIRNFIKVVFSSNGFICLMLFLFAFSHVSAQNKGFVVNGAYLVIDNAVGDAPYIIVKDCVSAGTLSPDCDFTVQAHAGSGTLGVIKPIGIGGTISIEGDWHNKCNNGAFSDDGVTVEITGSNPERIGPTTASGGYTTKFYNLTLGGTGLKTIDVDTWVGGISTLTGQLDLTSRTLDLNQHTLTIRNPAAAGITRSSGSILSETNSAVNPSIIKWEMATNTGAHVYPFGATGGDYLPFTFNKVSASSSTISVSTRPTLTNNNMPYADVSNVPAVTNMNRNGVDGSADYVIDRWWDITSSLNPLVGGGALLTFSYRGVENTITASPTGTISVQHWDGTTWETKQNGGSGVTTGIGTVTTNAAQTKFSPYILVADDNPLPIELLSYQAECYNDKTKITWTTTAETENRSFTVEKSQNGVDFEDLATVNAKGQYNNVNNYELVDANSFSGITYFRLRQTDLNGNTRLLGTVSAKCDPKDFEVLNVYNRNANELVLNYKIDNEQAFNITLYNTIGQQMATLLHKSVKGMNEVNFDVSNYSNGVYFLVMKNDKHSFTRKVILN